MEGKGREGKGREPHPFTPLLHVEAQEWEPSKLVAPAAEAERQEDGNDVVGDGDDVVKADDLLLHRRVLTGVCVLLNVGAELPCQIEFLLWKDSIPNTESFIPSTQLCVMFKTLILKWFLPRHIL